MNWEKLLFLFVALVFGAPAVLAIGGLLFFSAIDFAVRLWGEAWDSAN